MKANSNSSFYCPTYCFSKPLASSQPPPLKLPSQPPPPPLQFQQYDLDTKVSDCHSSCKPSPGSLVTGEKLCGEKAGVTGLDGIKRESLLKSCLKETISSDSKEIEKPSVKWMDDEGKELAQIREFEVMESGEHYDEMHNTISCSCVIQ